MSRRKARRLARRRSGKVPDGPTPNPPNPPQPTPPTPPTPDPTPPQPAPPTPPTPTPPSAGPTQADIDAAVAKALGVPLDQAKKALADAEKARKAQMTEAERLTAEAAEEKAKSAAAVAEAAKTTHEAKVTLALVRAGVHPDKLEWAARLVGAPVGADDKALADAIEAAKTAVPEVFAGTSTGPVPPPPPGGQPPPSNPPGSPPAPKPTPDVKSKAAALIAERFPNLAPKPGGNA